MGKLAEYVRSEAELIRTEYAKRRENLEEWRSAIDRLYDLLSGWIREADGGLDLLHTARATEVTVSEPRLGVYTMHLLWIILGGAVGDRKATVVPRARYVAGRIVPPGEPGRRADGMVEIKSGSSPEFYLFRVAGGRPEDDRWFIRDANAWDSRPGDDAVEPLDRDRFEAAVLRVLR